MSERKRENYGKGIAKKDLSIKITQHASSECIVPQIVLSEIRNEDNESGFSTTSPRAALEWKSTTRSSVSINEKK